MRVQIAEKPAAEDTASGLRRNQLWALDFSQANPTRPRNQDLLPLHYARRKAAVWAGARG